MVSNNYLVYGIDSKKGGQVISELRQSSGITLIVGSAVSQWGPTSIPTGGALTWEIAELLAESFASPEEHQRAKAYLGQMPFEFLCEKASQEDKLRNIILREFGGRPPNDVHHAISKLIQKGKIANVVTPNYDTCLDWLLPENKGFKHVVEEADLKKVTKQSGVLFKIHGSAEAGKDKTMIFTLEKEGELEPWKSDLLKDLVWGKTVLVMGYSGADFEITPILAEACARKIVWLFQTNPKRGPIFKVHNAEQVLNATHEAYALVGDIKRLLEKLGERAKPGRKTTRTILTRQIRKDFDQLARKLWASRALAQAGYAKYVEILLKPNRFTVTNSAKDYAEVEGLLGDALFFKGKYLDASEKLEQSSRVYKKIGEQQKYLSIEIRGIDALRCSGKLASAEKRLHAAKKYVRYTLKEKRELNRARLELQELLITREKLARLDGLPKFLRWPFSKRIDNILQHAREIAIRIAPVFANNGEWHNFQQTRMWIERMGMDFSQVYRGSLRPPIDHIGWRRMGHKVQEMMAVRDDLNRIGKEAIDQKGLERLIEDASDFQCDPEVWKLILAFGRAYGRRIWFTRPQWIVSFKRCQYTCPMGLMKLLAFEYR